MSKFIWNDELVSELKKLWELGVSTNEIGKKLGTTKNSIIGKVHRLNLESRESCIKRNSTKKETKQHNDVKQNKRSEVVSDLDILCENEEEEEKNLNKNLSLFDLGINMCHWPVGDPKKNDFHFCGHETREGEVYCDFHKAMSIVHGTKK